MLLDPNKQITKPIRCPDCWADMDFLGAQLNGRVFLSTILERHFFVCSNCGRLSYEIVLRPKEFIRFEAARFSQIDYSLFQAEPILRGRQSSITVQVEQVERKELGRIRFFSLWVSW
jgi:hypothetical protein